MRIFADRCPHSPDAGNNHYWTAGQRVDPNRRTPFIWRMKTASAYNETVSQMSYTNWRGGYPNYFAQSESCVEIESYNNYKFNDRSCSFTCCSVCEIDI